MEMMVEINNNNNRVCIEQHGAAWLAFSSESMDAAAAVASAAVAQRKMVNFYLFPFIADLCPFATCISHSGPFCFCFVFIFVLYLNKQYPYVTRNHIRNLFVTFKYDYEFSNVRFSFCVVLFTYKWQTLEFRFCGHPSKCCVCFINSKNKELNLKIVFCTLNIPIQTEMQKLS